MELPELNRPSRVHRITKRPCLHRTAKARFRRRLRSRRIPLLRLDLCRLCQARSTSFRSFGRSRSIGFPRRVRLTGALKASLATILCLAISGCLGYHVGPVKPYYLRDIHTIAVPTFKNRTLVPRIEVLVTDTVIKQFQQDGTFQITSDEKADATLSGEISHINRLPARSVRGNVLATTEFSLALTVKYLAHCTRRQTAGRSGRSNR